MEHGANAWPCSHCRQPRSDHGAGGKCLFDAGVYEAMSEEAGCAFLVQQSFSDRLSKYVGLPANPGTVGAIKNELAAAIKAIEHTYRVPMPPHRVTVDGDVVSIEFSLSPEEE